MIGSIKSHQIRAGTFACGAIASFVTLNPWHLGAAWLAAAAIITARGHARAYCKMMSVLAAPIGTAMIALLLFNRLLSTNGSIWGNATFGEQHVVPLLRLATIVSFFHLTALSLGVRDGVAFLRALRLPEDLVLIVSSALTLWPLMRQKIDDVITARYARGVLKRRHPLSGIVQLPYTIRTLFAFSLMAAHNRSIIWAHEGTLARLQVYQKDNDIGFDRRVWLPAILTAVWLAAEVIQRGT
jgi:energy-coupling factor transporter transmembrane protein EcfT